jgi:hypothetical protein
MTSSSATIDNLYDGDLLNRMAPIRAVDVILAALQSAFGQETLFNDTNPLRFNRNDPKNSRLWICDADSRVDTERDGRRMMVTVTRGDYSPAEAHLHNVGSQDMQGNVDYTDLASVPILIQCEAGNRISVEFLACCCYQILKIFRRQVMKDYDITNMKLLSISPPRRTDNVPGSPWICTVVARCEFQEFAVMTEMANHLNFMNIRQQVEEQLSTTAIQNVGSLKTVTPVIATPDAGTYTSPTTVTLTSQTPGTEIYYLVDKEGVPTIKDTRYRNSVDLVTPGTHSIIARAFRVGMEPSEVSHLTYTITA